MLLRTPTANTPATRDALVQQPVPLAITSQSFQRQPPHCSNLSRCCTNCTQCPTSAHLVLTQGPLHHEPLIATLPAHKQAPMYQQPPSLKACRDPAVASAAFTADSVEVISSAESESFTGDDVPSGKGTCQCPSEICPHSHSRTASCTGIACGCSLQSSPPCGHTWGTASSSLTEPGRTHQHLLQSAAYWEAFGILHRSGPDHKGSTSVIPTKVRQATGAATSAIANALVLPCTLQSVCKLT